MQYTKSKWLQLEITKAAKSYSVSRELDFSLDKEPQCHSGSDAHYSVLSGSIKEKKGRKPCLHLENIVLIEEIESRSQQKGGG